MRSNFTMATLAASIAIGLTAFKGSAITLLGEYTFDGDILAPSNIAPAVNFSKFSYTGSGVDSFVTGNPSTGKAYSATNWSQPTAADPLSSFFELTITPQPGFQVTLNRLELDERRSSTGIHNFQVRSSIDNYVSPLSTFSVGTPDVFRSDQTTTLGSAFNNLSNSVTFRVYGYNAEAGTGTWRVDNVQTFGEVSSAQPVPFGFSPGLGILTLGALGAITQLKRVGQRHKSSFKRLWRSISI